MEPTLMERVDRLIQIIMRALALASNCIHQIAHQEATSMETIQSEWPMLPEDFLSMPQLSLQQETV